MDLIEKSSQDKKYNDSQNADIWFSALRGQAFLIAGKKEAALKALKYSEALLQPNEPPEVLQLIYANGYIYSNQEEKALGIVNKIRENPTSSLFLEATALWINICDLSFNELEKQLSHTEKNYSKIAEVLARKAQDEERYDSAEKYARISIEKSKEKHLQPCYQVLADILMGKRFGVYIQIGFIKKHIDKKDWTDFDEVVKCYILSLENIEQYASSRLKSIIIYNLFLTHFIVADYYNTEKYADKLSELGLIDAGILEALLSILLRMGKVDKVISICEKREAPLLKIPRLMYIYASLLLKAGVKKQNHGYEILEKYIYEYSAENIPVFIEASLLLGLSYLDEKKSNDYDKLLTFLHKNECLLQFYILEALKESLLNVERANQLFAKVVDYLPDDIQCRNNIILNLIPNLKFCKNWSLCLELLDDIIPRDEITEIGIEYLSIALHANDYDRTRKICSDFRENNCYDWRAIEIEIQLTIKFSLCEAEKLINSLISDNHLSEYSNELNIWNVMIKYQQGTLGKGKECFNRYPAVIDIDAWFPWINVPLLLKTTGQFAEAEKYVYLLFQKFPNKREIKKCYINTFLFNDTDCPFPKFSEVKTGCAVTYTKNGSSEKHTVVIDDSPYTAEWRKEYYPDDPFSKKIMSKKVGDNFNISGIDQQLCKIIEIKSKHEFRLQQFMTEENNQVEDRTMIMINTPIDSNGNLDFSELIKSLSDSNKQRDQKVEFAIKMYKETISSIYIFSRFSNLSLTDTIDYFSQQSELYIYTAQGVKEEWRKCYNLLISKSKVVISPFTAKILIRISAYFELNIFSILRASNLEFCVSEYLLDDLKSEQKIPYSPYRLYLREGKPVIINNEDKIKKYNRALKDCIAFLSLVEIIPGDIAVDDFDLAKKAPKCLVSRSAYHSFKIASGKNMILWDDDSNIVKFYNIQDKTINIKNRVFSQAVFLAFQKMEVMTSSDITEANIFLLASNEYFSSFNAENIKEIFINLDKYSPLDLRLLKYFTSDSIDKKSLLNVTSEAIKIIWKESFNLMAISIIIDAVIENDIQVAKLLICDCLLFTMSNNICNNILEEFLRKYYCPTLPSPNNIDKHVQAS